MGDNFLKKIEYVVKSKFDKILDSKEKPILIDKPISIPEFQSPSKILLLRHDRIGDVIISTPLIKLLREKLPNSQIDILLSTKNITAKNAIINLIDNIYIYEKKFFSIIKLIREFKKEKYDLIIDLFDNASSTAGYLIKLIKPKYSIGIDKQNSSIYTHIVPLLDKSKYHIVERILQLLLPFGINTDSKSCILHYPLSQNDKDEAEKILGRKSKSFRLGINIAGSSVEKYWGTEQYIELINLFSDKHKNFEIIIFGTPRNLSNQDEIKRTTVAVLAPSDKSFHQYASVLSLCDVIITVDTAAVHLAAAFQIPCVALYSITGEHNEPIPWYPFNSPHRIITAIGQLNQIKVQDVIKSVEELL